MQRHTITPGPQAEAVSIRAAARAAARIGARAALTALALPVASALAATTPKPAAWTNQVSDLLDGYATLNGTLQTSASGTSFFFEYGPTTTYGTATPATPVSASTAQQQETATIPVAPGEQYHYQLVASNKGGTMLGGDGVFDTQPDPPEIGSAIGGAALPGVLGGGVPLLLRLDSPGTITVQVSIPASVAVASHVITHVPSGVTQVWLGSNRVDVDAYALAYDAVPVSQRAAKLLSGLAHLTLTVDATAEAHGVVSDLAHTTIALEARTGVAGDAPAGPQ